MIAVPEVSLEKKWNFLKSDANKREEIQIDSTN